MNWLVSPAPLPNPVDFSIVGVAVLVALLAACVPAVLAVRHALRRRKAVSDLQLRAPAVRTELRRHAA